MLFPHLLPAALLTLGGAHAELHPATSNFYFELPDLEAVVEAYQDAPLVDFLHDERIRTFVAKIAGEDPATFNMDLLIADGMNELFLELPSEVLHALDVLEELEWVSVSVSGVELEGLSDLVAASQGQMTPELVERLGQLQARVVLDFESKETAQQAMNLLDLAADELGGELRTVAIEPSDGGAGLEASVLTAPDGSGLEIWAILQDARVVMGAGIAAVAHYKAGGATLADNKSFQKSAAHFADPAGVTIVDTYLHVEGLAEIGKLLKLTGDVPVPVVEAISFLMQTAALGGEVEVRTRSQLAGNRFITEGFRTSHGDGTTILDIAGNHPVSPNSFRMVPEEAVACWATTLDKEAMRGFLATCLDDLCVEDPEQCLAAMKDEYGARPDEDLVDALGDEYAFYTMPFAGIGMPKVFVVIELEDPETFARGLEGLGAFLGDVTDGAVAYRSKPYRKHPFISFAPGMDLNELAGGGGAGGMFTSITPAFVSLAAAVGVLEDRAVVSLSNMYTKREMKRLMRGEGGAHPLASSEKVIPEGATSYGTTDWGTLLAGVYDAVTGFLPLIQQGAGGILPFEMSDLPPSEIFTDHFRPTITWGRNVDGGAYSYNEASFGPEIPVALGAAVLVGGVFAATTLEQEVVVLGSDEDAGQGSDQPKGDATQRTVDVLREIKISILVYKSDQGRYPSALADLLVPTEKVPKGFLRGSEVPPDGWGNAVNYFLSENGSSFRLWSSGPDGVDQNGDGDDVILSKQ